MPSHAMPGQARSWCFVVYPVAPGCALLPGRSRMSGRTILHLYYGVCNCIKVHAMTGHCPSQSAVTSTVTWLSCTDRDSVICVLPCVEGLQQEQVRSYADNNGARPLIAISQWYHHRSLSQRCQTGVAESATHMHAVLRHTRSAYFHVSQPLRYSALTHNSAPEPHQVPLNA